MKRLRLELSDGPTRRSPTPRTGVEGETWKVNLPRIGVLEWTDKTAKLEPYTHIDEEPARKANELIGEEILRALGGRPRTKTAPVLAF